MDQKVTETTKTSATADNATGIRDFRHSSEVESFYRFIHENNLRDEARIIIDKVLDRLGHKRKPAAAKRGRKPRKPRARSIKNLQ
jgi:hypothetical protein